MRVSIIILCLGIGSGVFAAPSTREAQFFSGVFLLQSIPGLSDGDKARKFRELELLTGIDARKAKSILSSCGARPTEGRKLCDAMISMITGLKGNPPAPAVPKIKSPIQGARR